MPTSRYVDFRAVKQAVTIVQILDHYKLTESFQRKDDSLNYLNIDRLSFKSSGGQIAFSFNGGTPFVMDNFTFELVPEPSPLLLATAGALLLCPLLKRKRA